jgi:pimeloyl-ACP methyl ester carboxylesterase
MNFGEVLATFNVKSHLQTGRVIAGPTVRRVRSALRSSPRHKRIQRASSSLSIRIPSTDGLQLLGYLYQAEPAPTPGLIILHSSDPQGQRHGFYLALADALQKRGISVLTFNFRGYPGSGVPATLRDFTMEKLVQDVRAALDTFLETGYIAADHVALYGHSYGAGIVLPTLTNESRFWKAILHGPPDWNERRIYGPNASQRAFFRARYWRYMTIDEPLPETTFLDLATDLDALRQIDSLPADHPPVLLLDGSRESRETRAFVRELYRRMHPPCDYYSIPQADHFCNSASFANIVVYDERTITLLAEYLRIWLHRPDEQST